MKAYQSKLFMPTLREVPAEAEASSHRLLLRAGLIRQLAAGVYTYMPLGRRVLRKLETIIREELDAVGAQELGMPAMQPADLWKQSGRYDDYGAELIRLQDRNDREFALGPTHEEVVTALVGAEVSSYRELPFTLYQTGVKFRDEKRPRYGLLRGREFVMMDAYSFDEDPAGLDQSYEAMVQAYKAIFRRIGLHYSIVEADGGAIGDAGGTHEFMALADIGEDTIVSCPDCGYAANLEKAEAGSVGISGQSSGGTIQRLYTPGASTITELCEQLRTKPSDFVKTLIYAADGRPIAALVRGDHEVNESKLLNATGAKALELADAAMTEAATGAPVGFAGPVGLDMPIYADAAVMEMAGAIVGAREKDWHLAGWLPADIAGTATVADIRNVQEGEACPRCGEGTLAFRKGIEVGHVFKLGTKYSESMGAFFADRNGRPAPLVMGCYGIGVSRLISALAEQCGTESGVDWPIEVAPYDAHILLMSATDGAQRELAERLANTLSAAGADVLVDDRNERPGVKFKDADLIGIPNRFVVGRGAAEGMVEWRKAGGETIAMPWKEAAAFIER